MKKHSSIIFAIMLLTSILANILVFPLNTYAETNTEVTIPGTQVNTLYKTSNYATYYFYNLHENFGYNLAESCGYVAAGMLLTFYDIYWNGFFVSYLGDPDYHLQPTIVSSYPNTALESPGVVSDYGIADTLNSLIHDSAAGSGVKDYSDYFDYIASYPRSYLHFELINIGAEQNLFHETGHLGLDATDIRDIMTLYLLNTNGSSDHITSFSVNMINENSSTATFSAIADLIDEGIPVIVSGYNELGNGHAMIAYDYSTNANGDIELYVHMGLTDHEEYTHVALSSTGFVNYVSAVYLEYSAPHFCSASYVKDNSSTFCSCALSIHPEHIHSYTYKIYSATYHKRICTQCGESTPMAHAVLAGGNTCIRCGAFVSVDGPIIVQGVNGASYVLNHSDLPYIASYITENGSYVLSNGVIVLQDEDVQDYLEDKLSLDNTADELTE